MPAEEDMDRDSFIASLNEDLETEFQSVVQYVQHTASITGPEYLSTVDELKVHLGQELQHAQILAEQIAFLGGTPTTAVPSPPEWTNSKDALQADLRLEKSQLERYRERFAQANDLGLADVAEALRPLLEQTQEHVRDLNGAMGN
jgi:bacterioferritin